MANVCALYRNDVHMSSHMVQLEQLKMQEQSLEHLEDKAAKQPQENKYQFNNQDPLWDLK